MPYINWKMDHISDVVWVDLGSRSIGPLRYAPFKISDLKKCGFGGEKQAEDQANQFDNLNILYVALTRAVEQLFICFTHTSSNYAGAQFLEACRNTAIGFQTTDTAAYKACDANGNLLSEAPDADEPFRLSLGRISTTAPKAEKPEALTLLAQHAISDQMWFDRFQIAYDRDRLNGDVSRKMGILFHNLAAESGSASEAQRRLEQWSLEGHVNREERSGLDAMLNELFSSPAYTAATRGAKIFAERELVHHGQVLRPDLIAVHSDKAVVIDFKTGDENQKEHTAQVLAYMEAAQVATGKRTEGFLVYLSPLRWVEVGAGYRNTSQASLFD
jgi:ATP-dependent exoDNAse (exonuclease V) beta subunit